MCRQALLLAELQELRFVADVDHAEVVVLADPDAQFTLGALQIVDVQRRLAVRIEQRLEYPR